MHPSPNAERRIQEPCLSGRISSLGQTFSEVSPKVRAVASDTKTFCPACVPKFFRPPFQKNVFARDVTFDIAQKHRYLAFSVEQALDGGTETVNRVVRARRPYNNFRFRGGVYLYSEFHALISFRQLHYTTFPATCKYLFSDRSFFFSEW